MRYPEITFNTQFGQAIVNLIINNKIKSVIEIGSGSGNGSTQCFIYALNEVLKNGYEVKLYCFEPVSEWYSDLVENTKNINWIKCFNNSAISYEDMLIKNYDMDFWENPYNHVKNIEPKEYREQWYLTDIEFFKNEKISILPTIEAECVLIDGCEFSGYSEFKKLNDKVQWIILDDCFNAFKTKQVYYELSSNHNYSLIAEGMERNGWAIFKKIN